MRRGTKYRIAFLHSLMYSPRIYNAFIILNFFIYKIAINNKKPSGYFVDCKNTAIILFETTTKTTCCKSLSPFIINIDQVVPPPINQELQK